MYAAFVSGFKHKMMYHIRTMPNIKQHLTRVDTLIDNILIPAITCGHICSADEQLLLSLPVKKSGYAIPIFKEIAELTQQLVTHINNQDSTPLIDSEQFRTSRRKIVNTREEQNSTTLQKLCEKMMTQQLRANDLAMMKGASSWLTTLPLKSESLNLNK